MLDIKFLREFPEKVKKACIDKNLDPVLVNSLLEIDTRRRELIIQVEKLRQNRNVLNEKLKKGRTPELLEEAGKLKKDLQMIEPALDEIGKLFLEASLKIPNLPFDDVPVGKDESGNQVLRSVGKPKKMTFPPKDHLQLGEALGIVDTNTASKVTGARFGYLKGGAAMLEFSLIHYCMQTLTNPEIIGKIANSVKKGYNSTPFVPIVPPVMIKPDVFRRMGRLSEADKDERYYLPQDDLYLIGSAEHTLGPLYMDQILPEKVFPLRFIGFSTAFRREAGSYGKDMKGILRVHQFDKLEMESFTLPEDSRTEQDFIVAVQEYLVSGLEIPYQVVSICTGDMGKPDARQIDIESWLPGQDKYRETHTSDLMTDYQSRRLETRVLRTSGETEYVHMNDATAIAIGRMVIAILENYQQKDGSIKVPTVLIPYMGATIIK